MFIEHVTNAHAANRTIVTW